MTIPVYQIDAFANAPFHGNPAAVCPLDAWLPDATLQSIALENNLSETAYLVRRGADYEIRWFTPGKEVDLCGHATLASAYVVFERLEPTRETVTFHSKSGPLTVARDGALLTMDFPARARTRCDPPAALIEGLGRPPLETWLAFNYLAVYGKESDVRALAPRMDVIASLETQGVIVTAPADARGGGEGLAVDFVSRYFAPKAGVPEDPVTGSAHCALAPYWAERLGKKRVVGHQVSARGGVVVCEDRGTRVTLSGSAVLFLEGAIRL